MEKKVDYQKINSLKAKVYDKLGLMEQHQIAMENLRKEINELNAQILEEQAKIKK